MAARRMKGVVRPQQAPTIRKPRTHRQIDGFAGDCTGLSESMNCPAECLCGVDEAPQTHVPRMAFVGLRTGQPPHSGGQRLLAKLVAIARQLLLPTIIASLQYVSRVCCTIRSRINCWALPPLHVPWLPHAPTPPHPTSQKSN